jgi:hypothetical protein
MPALLLSSKPPQHQLFSIWYSCYAGPGTHCLQAEKRARQRAREKAQKAQDMEALAAERKAAVEQEIAQAAAEAAQLAARWEWQCCALNG